MNEIKIHDSLTIPLHVNSDKFKKLVERAYRINAEQKRAFWLYDFEDLGIGRELYRKYIEEMKPYLEEVGHSKPKRWKFKGIKITGDSHRITLDPMVGNNFYTMLKSLKHEQLCFHDIKVKCHTKIHELLLKRGCTPHKSNKGISIGFPGSDNNIIVKIIAYPNTVVVDIGCTYKPLVYSSGSIVDLIELLSNVSKHLESLVNYQMELPAVRDWVVTMFHLNKDGTEEYTGEAFSHTIEEVNAGSIRFYVKEFPDKKSRLRVEKIVEPHKRLPQLAEETLV